MKRELRNLIIVALVVTIIGFVAVFTLVGEKVVSDVKSHAEKPANPSYPMITNLASAKSFSYGNPESKVTVVEFFDPECESCAAVSPYIKKEMKYYDGKVRWVFRYMPLHSNSKAAVKAIEAARIQGLFLEAMEILFSTQKEWGEKKEPTNEKINEIVSSIKGLDKQKYLKDLANLNIDEILNQDELEGRQAGVKGTPTFFVNNVMIEELNLDSLISRINSELEK